MTFLPPLLFVHSPTFSSVAVLSFLQLAKIPRSAKMLKILTLFVLAGQSLALPKYNTGKQT